MLCNYRCNKWENTSNCDLFLKGGMLKYKSTISTFNRKHFEKFRKLSHQRLVFFVWAGKKCLWKILVQCAAVLKKTFALLSFKSASKICFAVYQRQKRKKSLKCLSFLHNFCPWRLILAPMWLRTPSSVQMPAWTRSRATRRDAATLPRLQGH